LGDAVEHKFGRDATISGFNGDSFVENLEPTFDMKSFVIATGDAVVGDAKNLAHGNKITLEFAVIVNDDKAAEAGLEEHVAHEEVCKIRRVGFGDRFTHDKSGEVAHGSKQVSVEAFDFDVFVGDATWFPEVSVDNVKG